MDQQRVELPDALATHSLGGEVARACVRTVTFHLQGDLGAGKTTFCRGFLTALGHRGAVKSPTYTLVEPYRLPPWQVYHFDLYRIADPAELELIGIRDYPVEDALLLIEWPQQGGALIPAADLKLEFSHHPVGRQVVLRACSTVGRQLLQRLAYA